MSKLPKMMSKEPKMMSKELEQCQKRQNIDQNGHKKMSRNQYEKQCQNRIDST